MYRLGRIYAEKTVIINRSYGIQADWTKGVFKFRTEDDHWVAMKIGDSSRTVEIMGLKKQAGTGFLSGIELFSMGHLTIGTREERVLFVFGEPETLMINPISRQYGSGIPWKMIHDGFGGGRIDVYSSGKDQYILYCPIRSGKPAQIIIVTPQVMRNLLDNLSDELPNDKVFLDEKFLLHELHQATADGDKSKILQLNSILLEKNRIEEQSKLLYK